MRFDQTPWPSVSIVPREIFVPSVLGERGLDAVYRDEALVTKRDAHGTPVSSSSQPGLMADMLELLELCAGQRVLEVGAGTGYNAALMKHIVGERGRVSTIDVDAALAAGARAALRATGYRVRVIVGDGRRGWAQQAPYDRIIVTACADEIPRTWLDQLRDGGRLELPLRLDPDGAAIQVIPVLARRGDRLRSVGMTWGGFMTLHSGDGVGRPPLASLSASRAARGRHASLATLRGKGLERLSERASRELLAAIITGGAVLRAHGHTPMGSGQTPLLLVYLLLKIPLSRRITLISHRRQGIGVVDRRSGSVAVFSVRSPWSGGPSVQARRARWRLDAYRGDAAALELEGLLDQWSGAAGTGRRLSITASGTGDVLRLRFGWG